MIQKLREHSVFIILFIVCAILRLLPLFNYQFTYDELSGLERTQFNSFEELIQKGVKIDAHPALVQLLIFYIVKHFGYVTWIVKLPFLLAGFAGVVYGYLFGLRFFSKQVGLCLAGFLSFSLIFVFYTPIARMYITGVFFSMAMLYYFFAIFFQKDQHWYNWVCLGLFSWLSALNHHMGALFALTLFGAGFCFLTKDNYKQLFFTILCVLGLYLPHLPITLYQVGVGGIGRDQGGWLEAPGFQEIFSLIKILVGTGFNWIIIVLLVMFVIISKRKIAINKAQLLLLVLFVLNFLIIYLYSISRAPVYQHSVMLFSSIAFLIFVSTLLDSNTRSLNYFISGIVIISLLYHSYLRKDYLNQSVKTVFEYQFERTAHYKKLYGDKNVYPLFFDADNIMKKIYFEKYGQFECRITTDSIMVYPNIQYKFSNDSTVSSLRMFSEFVSELKCDYVALSSSMPLHQAIVKQYFPFLIENTQTQAVHFKVYSKNKNDKQVEEDSAISYGLFDKHAPFKLKATAPIVGFPIITGEVEFPLEITMHYNDVIQSEGMVMLTRVRMKEVEKNSSFEWCISIKDSQEQDIQEYSAKNIIDFKPLPDGETWLFSDHYFGTNHKIFKDNGRITSYLWNKEKTPVQINDLRIDFIDHWNQKWHYWD